MDQHTFLELVVLGAAIGLSGYIGYAVGHFNGYEEGGAAMESAYKFSAFAEKALAGAQPESTVYYGNDLHGGFHVVDIGSPMTKQELRKVSNPRERT